MKVYIYYLSFSSKLKYQDDDELSESYYNLKNTIIGLTKYYNEPNDTWYYLYAFTNNKEIAEIFEATHDMTLFIKSKKKMDESEYREFRHNNILSELIKFEIEKGKNIICTKNESNDIDECVDNIVTNKINDSVETAYSPLKNEYIEALDKLLYCSFHTINWGDGCESDTASYNLGYGCSAEGYLTRTGYNYKLLNGYISNYKLILKKG